LQSLGVGCAGLQSRWNIRQLHDCKCSGQVFAQASQAAQCKLSLFARDGGCLDFSVDHQSRQHKPRTPL
jgi:hypothetical protein